MKLSLITVAAAALLAAGAAQAADTLAKIKETGSAVMGVRESSGALSYTLGDGKYAGFHTEICQRVLGDIQKKLGSTASNDFNSTTEPTSAKAKTSEKGLAPRP